MSITSRGFSEERQKIKRGSKFTRSCLNCDYYYKTLEDDSEVCQNDQVQEYDMVVDANSNNIFCSYWKQLKTSEDSLFSSKESHRARLFKKAFKGE